MGKPHILAIPYPAQGHVIPLMELSLCLAKHGFKVTFVNTDLIHKRVISALSAEDKIADLINLVSIPDGMEPWEDRNELGKLTESIGQVMPGKLQELIEHNKGTDQDEITCIIADENLGWALSIGEKMGIKRAAFWSAAAAILALIFSIPELIKNKVVDKHGAILQSQMINLSPGMPTMNTRHFAWACIGDLNVCRILFELCLENNKSVKLADRIICNTSEELEPAALAMFPEILPIGPLLASCRLEKAAGNFWPEDASCLSWLDQQPNLSVIYVAFGSFTIFDPTQLQELASGLELTNRPFLWVVRPDMTNETTNVYLKGFLARIGTRAKVVDWAPQQKVLNHPSVGCFLSHCGWNSTMEGVSNGIPFLCWPYFADQFVNQTYICDVWKIGLGVEKDDTGIITKGEIKNKVEQLFDDKTFRERALVHKGKAANGTREGGSSNKNMNNLIEWLNQK